MSPETIMINGVDYIRKDIHDENCSNSYDHGVQYQKTRQRQQEINGCSMSVIAVIPHYTTMGDFLRLEVVDRGRGPSKLPNMYLHPGDRIKITKLKG